MATTLPTPATPLLGRATELADVSQLLNQPEVRLVTLTGPPGVGKTRLALEVARGLHNYFEGVAFVALAPVTDPDLVASTIAHALDLHQTGTRSFLDLLQEFLHDKHLLLLLDNFEQVSAAAPLVAELLAAPRVKVFVTSREVLHLYGEYEFPLLPLALPDLKQLPPLNSFLQSPAVALFSQRAHAARPGFRVTEQNAAAVAAICVRLDGLPLAIELAAARVKLFSPQALLARLESRLQWLTGGARDLPARQQTLRAAIAWSFNLLEEGEQVLFRRLGVFVGGWTLEAAEEVCHAGEDLSLAVLDGLASLVDKSLVQEVEGTDGEPRFFMLETIREYAREQLVESGEAERLHRRHAQAFLTLAERAEPALRGPDQLAWLDRLEMEHDNLRAALARIQAAGSGEAGLRLTVALLWFWYVRGYASEGRRWLESALEQGADAAIPLRVKALNALAWLIEIRHDVKEDFKTQRAHLDTALALARSVGDKHGIANSLYLLGRLSHYKDDLANAFRLTGESLILARELGDTSLVGDVLFLRAFVSYDAGDLDRARTVFEESLTLYREQGDLTSIARALLLLGEIIADQGDLEQAAALYHESLALHHRLNFKPGHAWLLKSMGELAWTRADYDEAAERFAMSLDLFRELGNKFGAAVALHKGGYVARHQGKLAEAEALLEEGLALYQVLGNRWGIPYCLAGFGVLALARAQPERATRLFGAASALITATGSRLELPDSADFDDSLATVRAQLDEAAFAAAWAGGQAMTMEEAIAYTSAGDPAPRFDHAAT
jgi:predicted ATPase